MVCRQISRRRVRSQLKSQGVLKNRPVVPCYLMKTNEPTPRISVKSGETEKPSSAESQKLNTPRAQPDPMRDATKPFRGFDRATATDRFNPRQGMDRSHAARTSFEHPHGRHSG